MFSHETFGHEFKNVSGTAARRYFEQSLVKSALDQVLIGVDFLHDANVIHTGEFKIRFQVLDIGAWINKLTNHKTSTRTICSSPLRMISTMEEDEIRSPSARKKVDDTFIYISRYMIGGAGPLTICDLGQARIGKEHNGSAMPLPYRAPEVILDMKWDQSVDMWSLGLLVSKKSFFYLRNVYFTKSLCLRHGIYSSEKVYSDLTILNHETSTMLIILQQ